MGISNRICKLFGKDEISLLDIIVLILFLMGWYWIYLYQTTDWMIIDYGYTVSILIWGSMFMSVVCTAMLICLLGLELSNIVLFESKRR